MKANATTIIPRTVLHRRLLCLAHSCGAQWHSAHISFIGIEPLIQRE
jgi:hypothetical protein